MGAENVFRAPTVYEELLFIDRIYKTREELQETLQDHGFELYADIEVPKVDCFLYLPAAFPKSPKEIASFDFGSYQGKKIPIGVCIGGTCLSNGWDEKCKLGVQGILKINHNCSSADKAATQIFLALDDFYRDFDELSNHDITLDVHICGYSLGGLFAQVTTVLLQDWANIHHGTVTCRTYEAPGVPEMYHEISRHYGKNAEEYWKQRITNFKSLPNPLNTVFQDLGRVFHLKNTEHIYWNKSWVIKCVAGTARRIVFWATLLRGFGVSSIEKAFESLSKDERRLIIGATLALELGMDLCEIVHNHDVALMMTCFDEKSGTMLPHRCLEMEQWPIYDMFEETAAKMVQSVSQGLMFMDPRNAGLHTLFLFGGKRGFVERKLKRIPGYLPMTEEAKTTQRLATLVEG